MYVFHTILKKCWYKLFYEFKAGHISAFSHPIQQYKSHIYFTTILIKLWSYSHFDDGISIICMCEVFVWDLCQEPIPLRGAKCITWAETLIKERHFSDQMKVQREAEDHCIKSRVSEKCNTREARLINSLLWVESYGSDFRWDGAYIYTCRLAE